MKKVIVLIAFIVLASSAYAHTGNDRFDHCSGFCPMLSGDYGTGWMALGWIAAALIAVVLILFAALLIKYQQKRG